VLGLAMESSVDRRRPCGKEESPVQDGGGSFLAVVLDSGGGGACALEEALQGLQASAVEPIGSGGAPQSGKLADGKEAARL
jgi:hypothetical protein